MGFPLCSTMVAAAVGFIVIFRKFRSHHENKEIDSSSLSTSSPPPSSLSISSVSPNQSQIQIPSSPPSSLSPSSPPSLSLSSASSSTSRNWTYDVFPSFRGEDVRSNFLSHIQKEFQKKGITQFNDNGIKRGESISPELISAIRGSKIAIILLSENYASSKWCLDELVEIMKCKEEELGQTVIPVFYKVDPSDVKKLTGDFGKAFKKTCKGKSKEDIGRWKQALEKVATIAGYHLNNWENEAALIEKLAMDVSKELINYAPSSDFDGLVGMRAHMEKMDPFLLLGSDEVRMIGIWGPSGIGKTTIARVLFSKYSSHFQLSVFMDDIKRHYPGLGSNDYSTKLKLQNEFLSQIIDQKDIKIYHLGVVQDRLKDKRVLVVLDDVDHLMHLEAMAKEARWFGPGSRIIITTQDKKLLNTHGINYIYQVDFPTNDEALEIFCMYAFEQKSPYDGFENLAREVTRLAGELPLGLRVMGSYFKGMSKRDWEEELPNLRHRFDGEIKSILKFSYDALCDEDQALFLHIACFFTWKLSKKVEAYLSANFVGVKSCLRVLVEKSLISITSSGYIKMHDLLVRLGREIVRQQSPNEPGKRQFLVDARDICQVLRNDKVGSQIVIGIDCHQKLKISNRAFERMSNVQLLRLYCDQSLSCLPPNLTFFHWKSCLMTCLPSNFNTEFLVEINMRESNLEKLWEGNTTIRNLKWMDLSYSRKLKELPDLSTATNLRELSLSSCTSLVELPSSIGKATNLEELDLSECSSLVELPSSIWDAVNLRILDLSFCSSLVKLPSFSGNTKIKLKELWLCRCTNLMQLPSSMENAPNLEILNLVGCLHLRNLPSSIGNLRELYLTDCSSLVELPSSARNALNLEDVSFNGCSSLVELPLYLGNFSHLEEFDLSGCSSLRKLPSYIGNMIDLEELNLIGCSSLVDLPSSIGNLHKLKRLLLKGCSKLKALPINMESLEQLDLTDCSSLKSFPEISTNIRSLELIGTAIHEIPTSIRSWSRLECLDMSYSENLGKPWYALDRITELDLSDTRIKEIAPWIKDMSRLKGLVIKRCTKLVSLPRLPDSLKFLYADSCESLERLDCMFYNTELHSLGFVNCFELNQEAKDLIIKTSTKGWAVLPGEEVPTYFTFRATGSSLSMKWNEFNSHFPTSLRIKACVLLLYKVEAGDRWCEKGISYRIKNKLDGVIVNSGNSYSIYFFYPPAKKHLVVFEFETTVTSAELVFEFEFNKKGWEIEECGICLQESKAPYIPEI